MPAEPPSAERVTPPFVDVHDARNTYTGLPPSRPGVNVTVAWPLPGVATTFVGAYGTSSTGLTVTVTVSGALDPKPSFTTSWNCSVCGPIAWVTVGAVNVGWAAVVDDSVTVGPLTC